MGMKKLARKRLFNIEKQGIDVDISTAPGMKPAIVSATQHREGYKVVTDIVVDLGTSKTTVKSGGTTAAMPVGTLDAADAAELSYICQLTPAVFGTVTNVESMCLEKPTDGLLEGANAYKLVIGDGNGKIGVVVTNLVSINSDHDSIGDAIGVHDISTEGDFSANGLENKYLYIAGGSGVGTHSPATCVISGIPANIDNFVAGLSILTLQKAKGTDAHYSMVVDTGSTPTATANKLMLNGAASVEDIADRIVQAVNKETSAGAAHGMAAVKGSGPAFDVTVTQHSTTGADGNLTNVGMTDAPGKTTGISVTDFANGTTTGTSTAMTAGKFLIRVEGFMTPDDI